MGVTISKDLAGLAAQGTSLDKVTTLGLADGSVIDLSKVKVDQSIGATRSAAVVAIAHMLDSEGIQNPAAVEAAAKAVVAQLPDGLLTDAGLQSFDLLPVLMQTNVPDEAAANVIMNKRNRLENDRDQQLRDTATGLGLQGADAEAYVAKYKTPILDGTIDIAPTSTDALKRAQQVSTIAATVPADQQDTAGIPPPEDAAGSTFGTTGNSIIDGINVDDTPAAATGAVDSQGNPLRTPFSEEDMRNLYSTDDLSWNDLRANEDLKAAWAQQGFAQPGQPMVDTGYGDPRGPGGGGSDPNARPRDLGLLDAVQELDLRSPEEIQKAQERMVAAGYLSGDYRPGIADAPTRTAWRNVVQEAWYEKTPMSSILANGATAVDKAKAQAEADAKKNRSYQITDPVHVKDIANAVAMDIVGRKLSPDEERLIIAKIGTMEKSAYDSSQTPGSTYSQPDIESQVTDWLTNYRSQDVGLQRAFTEQQSINKIRGIHPKVQKFTDEQWAQVANNVRTGRWSSAQLNMALTGTEWDTVDQLGGP